jgi:hypothetical protein
MPESDWPDFPLVFSKGVPFLVATGFIRLGPPPNIKAYVTYCKENGLFRKQVYDVPLWTDALVALRDLVHSQKWQCIKWQDAGTDWSYGYDEQVVEHRLHMQIERMKNRCATVGR